MTDDCCWDCKCCNQLDRTREIPEKIKRHFVRAPFAKIVLGGGKLFFGVDVYCQFIWGKGHLPIKDSLKARIIINANNKSRPNLTN